MQWFLGKSPEDKALQRFRLTTQDNNCITVPEYLMFHNRLPLTVEVHNMNEPTQITLKANFMSLSAWDAFKKTELSKLDGEHLCITSESRPYRYKSNGEMKDGMEKKDIYRVKNGKATRWVANMSVGYCLESNIYHNGSLKNIYFVGFSDNQQVELQKVIDEVNKGAGLRKFGDAIISLLSD